MTEATEARTDAHGLAIALVLVVVMAATVVGLGLSGAFPSRPGPADASGRQPVVTIDGALGSGPASGHVYRLAAPHLTKAAAQRVLAAAGVSAVIHREVHGEFAAGRGVVMETPMGWFVIAPGAAAAHRATSEPAPVPPSVNDAVESARAALASIGVPADLVRAGDADPKTGVRRVEVDRVVDGSVVRPLRFTVDVGPGKVVEGLTGLFADVVDEGSAPIRTSRTAARDFAVPAEAPLASDGSDQLALWAVTVGTNMMGYTPVFGSSVKYVLLGSGSCSIDIPSSRPPFAGAASLIEGCFLQQLTSVDVRAARPVTGLVAVGRRGATFLVPSYRFTVRLTPRGKGRPRDTTLTIAAVSRATLDRLANQG